MSVTLTADSRNLLVNHKNFLPCGSIVSFAGSTAPTGWLICDGRELPVLEYSALFDIIGYTYGNDSTGYFCLPDLQDRVPVGKKSSTTLGAIGGNSSVTLTTNQMPSHTHSGTVDASGAHTHTGTAESAGLHTHTITDPGHTHSETSINDDFNSSGGSAYPAGSNPSFAGYDSSGVRIWNNISSSTTGISVNSADAHSHSLSINSNGSHSHTFTTGTAGSGASIDIRNPYIVLNYIIKY